MTNCWDWLIFCIVIFLEKQIFNFRYCNKLSWLTHFSHSDRSWWKKKFSTSGLSWPDNKGGAHAWNVIRWSLSRLGLRASLGPAITFVSFAGDSWIWKWRARTWMAKCRRIAERACSEAFVDLVGFACQHARTNRFRSFLARFYNTFKRSILTLRTQEKNERLGVVSTVSSNCRIGVQFI